MTHAWHDTFRHSSLPGGHAGAPAHHLDPRSKIFAGLAFVGTVLFTRQWTWVQWIGYAAVLVTMMALARLTPMTVLKRMAGLLPFALLMILSVTFSSMSLQHVA